MALTLDQSKAALLDERELLLRQIDELTVGGAVHLDFDDNFADSGQVAAEQGENKVLADSLQDQLRAVDRAIEKIEQGMYGACETCGERISDARLEAMPATAYCIDHA